MGRLKRVLAVALFTYRETVRQKVLYNLVFFAIVLMLAGTFLGRLSLREEGRIIRDLGLAAIDLFGLAIALFIGVGLVSRDIERRTLYPILAKPVDRDELYLGKFVGLGLVLLVNAAAMTAGLQITLAVAGGGADLMLLQAIAPLFLGHLLVVALAMLLSSSLSPALSFAGTIALVIAGRFADVIRNMQEIAPGVPAVLTRGLYYALPNFRNFDFKNQVAYGDPVPPEVLGFCVLYVVVYCAVALVAGTTIFRARDLP